MKVEREIQTSEFNTPTFKAILKHYPGLVWAKNLKLQYTFCNDRYLQLFSNNILDSIVGQTDYDLFDKDLAQKFSLQDLQVLEYATEVNVEETLYIDDEWCTFEIIRTPNKNEVGEVIGIIAYCRDITLIRKNEDTIHKLRKALEHSPNSVIITNEKGRIEYVNKKFIELTGYSELELLGKNPRIIKIPGKKRGYTAMWRAIFAGKEWYGEFYHKKKNGAHFNGKVLVTPIKNSEGVITNFVAIKEEVKQSNLDKKILSDLKTMIEMATKHLTQVVWLWDEYNNHLLYVNPAFEKVWGYSCESFYNNYSMLLDTIHPDDQQAFASKVEQSNSHDTLEHETRILQANKTVRWIRVSLIRIKNEAGCTICQTGIAVDITALKNAENVQQSKSQFLANMSHELRTPLNAVIGFSELLSNTKLDNAQKQYTNAINISALKLLGLINDVLEFSNIEANKIVLEKQKTPIYQLFEQSIEMIKIDAAKKGLEILLDIDDSMPYYATIDAVRLAQVLTKLLSNAVKFTHEGELELKVKYQALTNDRGKFAVLVRDTGIGISDNQKQKLFQAFSQADNSSTRSYGGAGLGLIISDRIAQKMGSKIHLCSTIDAGSCFSFEFEAEVEADSDQTLQAFKSSLNVLIIDANKQACDKLSTQLSKWGVSCESCENEYLAFMQIMYSDPFDLIFVNNEHKTKNGINAISVLVEKGKIDRNNIILMHGSTEDLFFYESCAKEGIKRLITKPIKIRDLHILLSDYLNSNKKMVLNSTNYCMAKINILIVDDDMFNILVAKALITNILPNANISEAWNGKIAYDITKKCNFHLIFMDVHMPELDGIEATKAIRKYQMLQNKYTPIIGLTASALAEERKKCYDAGMDYFLTKPIDSVKLKSVIEEIMTKKE